MAAVDRREDFEIERRRVDVSGRPRGVRVPAWELSRGRPLSAAPDPGQLPGPGAWLNVRHAAPARGGRQNRKRDDS